MKKVVSLHQAAAVFIMVIFLLPGCNKLDSVTALTTDEVVPCQVQQMVYPSLSSEALAKDRARIVMRLGPNAPVPAPVPSSGNNDTAVFTYNALGNPVSIVHKTVIGDNFFFKYDHANRLTDFIVAYAYAPADGGDQWHKYSYDPHNTTRVIADTDYILYETDNAGTMTSYEEIELTTFQYDAQNRISKTKKIVFAPGITDTVVTAYTYDSHGNLETSGGVYDNKINVHRTNKIWMFLDRNYSVNNPVDNRTYTYNQADLPITIAVSSPAIVAGFDFTVTGYPVDIENAIVGYSCSVP